MKAVLYAVCLTVYAMCLPDSLLSQEAKELSLSKCVEIALAKNLKLIEAELKKKATGLQANASLKDMLPRLSTSYSYLGSRDASTITIYDNPVRISSHDNYDWQIILTQPIFQGGRLLNSYKIASINYDISKMQLAKVKNDLVLQVKEAYYSILQAQKITEENQAAVKRLKAHLMDAEGFYEVGLIAKNDLLQSQLELAQARQNLISARHDLELAKAGLNRLLRQNLDTPVVLAGKLEETDTLPDLHQIEIKALSLRPEIRAGKLAVAEAEKRLKVAKSGYWPQVDLTATYEKRGITPDVSDYPFGDHDMAQILLNVTWELWAWGQTRDQVQAADYLLQSSLRALDEVKDSVALEVKTAWLKFKEAKANIDVAKAALAHAQENFRLNTQRYKEQLATSTDVLDAQALLTRARTNYYNAMAQELIAKARLNHAAGLETD